VVYNAVCVYRPEGCLPLVYVAGTDKSIREIEQASVTGSKTKDTSNLGTNGKELVRYDESIMYSQLIASQGRRTMFAGIAEDNKPGAIHLIKHPFEKICEIQAHS